MKRRARTRVSSCSDTGPIHALARNLCDQCECVLCQIQVMSTAMRTWKYDAPVKLLIGGRWLMFVDSMLLRTGWSCRSISGMSMKFSPARRPATSDGVLRGAMSGLRANISKATTAAGHPDARDQSLRAAACTEWHHRA